MFLPSLEFDDCQAGRVASRKPALDRVIGALAPLMGLLANSGDTVIVSNGYEPTGIPESLNHVRWSVAPHEQSLPTHTTLVPWGWDTKARQLAERLNPTTPPPSVESVSTVNQRSFLAEYDRVDPASNNLPFGKTFGCLCRDEPSVGRGLERITAGEGRGWIIKSEWTASGRNRLVGRGTSLTPQQRNWTRRQLSSGGAVYLEPQVHVVRECGIQLQVLNRPNNAGTICELLGVVELVTDPNGRYTGSIVTENWDCIWQPAVDHGRNIAAAAAELGYFGPLGIDCMLAGMPDGSQVLRMAHDINGRHTMGRLAWSLLQRLKPGQAGFWRHSAPSDLHEDDLSSGNLPAGSPVNIVDSVSTSPKLVGGQPPAIQTRFFVTSSLSHARMLVEITKNQHQQKI
jgi:hypothetical protein